MKTGLEAFLQYSKQPAFERFMLLWKKQYIRLNRLGGSITIVSPSPEESEVLAGFIGKDYRHCETIKITYTEVKKALASSIFEEVDLMQALLLYFEEDFVSNNDLHEQKQQQESSYFEKLMKQYEDTPVYLLLEVSKTNKNAFYDKILSLYRQSQQNVVTHVLRAINNLPYVNQQTKRLDVFANTITRDSHYFDEQTAAFSLLLQGICLIKQTPIPKRAEAKHQLLYEVGLLKDNISNFVYTYHICMLDQYNQPHPGWQGFYEQKEILTITLRNLTHVSSIDNKTTGVYIFENPSVFEALSNYATEKHFDTLGFICISGQPNIAAYVLMDYIQQANIPMFYAGDFDPEGVLIADKLIKRYPLLQVIGYTHENYLLAISDKILHERRLAILNNCTSVDLKPIVNAIQTYKKGAYQEALLDVYQELVDNYLYKLNV